MKNIKKLLLTVSILALAGCSQQNNLTSHEVTELSLSEVQVLDPEIIVKMDEKGELDSYTEISLTEVTSAINSSEDALFVVASTDCSFCWYLKPSLNRIADEMDYPVYIMDISNVDEFETEDEYLAAIEEVDNFFYNEIEYVGTPHVFRVIDGEIKFNTIGFLEFDELISGLNLEK